MSQHVVQADDDPPMGRNYAIVIARHLAVITGLVWFGRTFAV